MEPRAHTEAEAARSGGILGRLFGRLPRKGPGSTRQAPVVTIASGKGGTGKSFLATNLAVAIADLGRRVALVDGDFSLANAHLLLGVRPRWTVEHVLAGRAPMSVVATRTAFGPTLVPGGSGIPRLAELDAWDLVVLAEGMRELAETHDCVLLDTSAGISPQCLALLAAADRVVLVTNPEIAALTDAYAVVKCLSKRPRRPPVSIVVNRVTSREQARRTFAKLADVAMRFSGSSLHYLGAVPEEPAVTPRRLGQPPLMASHPECEAACSIKEVLARLVEVEGELRPRRISAAQAVDARMRSSVVSP